MQNITLGSCRWAWPPPLSVPIPEMCYCHQGQGTGEVLGRISAYGVGKLQSRMQKSLSTHFWDPQALPSPRYPHAAVSLPSHPVGWRRRDASRTAKQECCCSLFPLLKLRHTRQAELTPFQGVQTEKKKMQGKAKSKDSLAAQSPVFVDIKPLKLSEHKISPYNIFFLL